jgi:hypothetical protein
VQSAALHLLSRRLPADTPLSGPDLKDALQSSGLFLEKTLSTLPAGVASGGAMPDMKAALIVFRQLLAAHLPNAQSASHVPSPSGTPTYAPANVQAAAQLDRNPQAAPAVSASHATLAPELDVQEILLPQARLPVADDVLDDGGEILQAGFRGPMTGNARTTATETGIALNLLQEAMAASRDTAAAKAAQGAVAPDELVTVQTNLPPPPVRGAAPSAQPVAVATLATDAAPEQVVHRLLNDTDAVLARQTLLQVASLPDRVDASPMRSDTIGPRWNFEIPFAMPLGAAVAQFEIARDSSHANEAEAAKHIWRARFSLDIEPAGPVHTVVSLNGDTTSVRMWAERPATASRLRADASLLSEALSRAELIPGDISIRDGSPPQPAGPTAGHFLDRAM